jgi:glycosyltransferase involved in cell wall biosynthesis
MHMGVPCLVSDRVGCQRDLVSDGETGWHFSVHSPGGLRDALGRALNDITRDAQGFRQRVLSRVSAFTYAQAAEGLAEALRHATRTSAGGL